MAWSYVLRQITSKNGFDVLATTGARVVFHIGIPNTENEVGVNYRDAAVELATARSSVHSQVKDLETRYPARYAKLQSGEVVEMVEDVYYGAMHLTVAERTASIAARASAIEDDVIDILLLELDLSGLVIDD